MWTVEASSVAPLPFISLRRVLSFLLNVGTKSFQRHYSASFPFLSLPFPSSFLLLPPSSPSLPSPFRILGVSWPLNIGRVSFSLFILLFIFSGCINPLLCLPVIDFFFFFVFLTLLYFAFAVFSFLSFLLDWFPDLRICLYFFLLCLSYVFFSVLILLSFSSFLCISVICFSFFSSFFCLFA